MSWGKKKKPRIVQNQIKGHVQGALRGKSCWLPSSPPCRPPSSSSPCTQTSSSCCELLLEALLVHVDESGRGSWQGLCSGWPRVATAEGEGSSAAKGNSGCGPDKLNPSSDLQGESRLRKMRGEVKGQGDPAGGQECTCKPRPRERVQGHIDE